MYNIDLNLNNNQYGDIIVSIVNFYNHFWVETCGNVSYRNVSYRNILIFDQLILRSFN